ncbi:MAG: hypothetical protein R3200_01865 [Xanthomonadales bacterium]|nr:hypothetical protein [Xanthomonadales bacterium]
MNRSELERQLRSEAQAMDLRCPDTPRQRVMRTLRQEADGTPVRGWWSRWRPLAATAAMLLVVVAVLQYGPEPAGEAPPVVTQAPAQPALELPSVSGDLIDRAMAEREASLEAELQRIQADLRRIKSLVKNV